MKDDLRLDGKPLDPSFFARDALVLAEELIGCILVRRPEGHRGPLMAVMLTETEAYQGMIDQQAMPTGVLPRGTK